MNLNSVKRRYSEFGLRRTAYWYLMTLLQHSIGLRLHHVFIRHGIPEKTRFRSPPGYSNREVTPDELLGYIDTGAVSAELSADFLHASAARNDHCVASFFGEELVGFDFSSTTEAPVTSQLEIVVPPGFRYGYKGWTHPDHRRKHLSLLRIEAGYTTELAAMYYIETHNYPSLLRPYRYPVARRLHMGYIGWIEFRGRQYPFATRRARWVGIELQKKGAHKKRLYTEL